MVGLYQVIETGKVGQLVPCPCDNPIILEFKDGCRDAFFLRELEPTTVPLTDSYPTRGSAAKKGRRGRPRGLERRTIQKILWIYQFLKTQSQPGTISMERLGIVERIAAERTRVTWRLTERGRARGARILDEIGNGGGDGYRSP